MAIKMTIYIYKTLSLHYSQQALGLYLNSFCPYLVMNLGYYSAPASSQH